MQGAGDQKSLANQAKQIERGLTPPKLPPKTASKQASTAGKTALSPPHPHPSPAPSQSKIATPAKPPQIQTTVPKTPTKPGRGR